jgi:hypothetical protein
MRRNWAPLALQAAKNGLHVTAIDTAPVTTAHLAEQMRPYPGCTAEVMDALQMRWNKGQFDAAFSVHPKGDAPGDAEPNTPHRPKASGTHATRFITATDAPPDR